MASVAPATNLTSVASSFVGRASDVSAIAERLEEARLVTILGPGGVGKTRLAIRFAEERTAAFAEHGGGGVWFCDLSRCSRIEDIVASVASALGVELEGQGNETALVESLGRAIARRGHVLIVLDNFDRLVAHAPATVGVWLAAASSARFLVTSRASLDVMGEQLWSLSPLPPDDAVELFARRAGQVQPSFDIERERSTVSSIVDAIDRMPLAIELAATRMAVLSAVQLRERLERPLDILAGRRQMGRHASMRQTILDSVDMLSVEQRRLFVACAVMRNGFTLETVEAVMGDHVVARSAVIDELAALVKSSLLRMHVVPGDAARYAFFETIRDVAEELAGELAQPDVLRLRERYASYYATLARGLRRDDESLRAAERDLDNLLRAQEVAVSLAVEGPDEARAHEAAVIALGLEPILSARGLARVCAALFDAALDALDAVASRDFVLRAEVHLARGFARRELGETAMARSDFEKGLAAAREAKEPSLAAVAMTRLGDASDVAGDTETARAHFDEALALLATTPDDEARARREGEVYLQVGHAHRREGDLPSARAAILLAVERYRALGDDEGLASAMYELAVVEMFAGAHDEALARFDEGLEVARRGELRVLFGALKTARGCLLQDAGRLEEALDHHAEAARVFHEAGSRYREGSATYYLASTYLERGDAREAESMSKRARACLVGVGASRYEALIAGCQASALAASGDLDRAEVAMAHAERAAAAVRNEPALTANVTIHRLALELRRRAWDGADAAVRKAASLVEASPSDDSRFAFRVLQSAARGERREHDALVVFSGGRGFRAPGSAEVELPERSPLRRILEHFARRRIDAPGEVVTLEEIVRAGWPAEKIGTDAALNRAYVALTSLRKMGLRGLLLHGGGGYALSQAVMVRIEG